MKRILIFLILLGLLYGCAPHGESAQIAATTLPIYEFTVRLCQGTGISVTRLINENVSCLHDYSLQVKQMRILEQAELVVINGGGLEDFMEDVIHSTSNVLDASAGMELIYPEIELDHEHHHAHDGHHHDVDPHLWLSPVRATEMTEAIYQGLCNMYPEYQQKFSDNLTSLQADLLALQTYAEESLSSVRSRELLTFHDGFAYLAESFGLTVLEAVEEESGSEAPASELIRLIRMVETHQLPAIFTETNGSTAAAEIISAETGAKVFSLDMIMAGDSYFDAMYRNIDTLKEALG